MSDNQCTSLLTPKIECDQTAMSLPLVTSAVFLTYIPEGVAEASQIFLRDANVLPKCLSYVEYRRDRW
jgi:hypothetical protein